MRVHQLGFGILVSLLSAGAAVAAPLDLGGVTSETPDFSDRPHQSTTFSGSLIATTADEGTTIVLNGNGAGDLVMGGSPDGADLDVSHTYALTFADAVSMVISIVDPPAWGASDMLTFTATGANLLLTDPGLNDFGAATGSGTSVVSLTGNNSGDNDWFLTTDGTLTALTITYTSTTGGGNQIQLHLDAEATAPEPASTGLAAAALAFALLRRRR